MQVSLRYGSLVYSIKPHKDKKKSGWVVITPSGRIANQHIHATKEQAQRHMEILMAYWPAGGPNHRNHHS